MAYRKLRTVLGSYISMIRIRDRWPTKDLDSCISRFAAPGIGASLESFSLTLVDVGLEEGGLVLTNSDFWVGKKVRVILTSPEIFRIPKKNEPNK